MCYVLLNADGTRNPGGIHLPPGPYALLADASDSYGVVGPASLTLDVP